MAILEIYAVSWEAEAIQTPLMSLTLQGQVSPKQPEISPEGVAHLSQSKLLPMLLDCARSYHSTADIRFDHKVTSVKTFGGHVNVRAEGLEVTT